MSTYSHDRTYYSLAKWFKWASIIIILVPLTVLILNIIQYCQPFSGYEQGIKIVSIIAFVAAIIWIVLNIIMFFAAGNLREIRSPFWTRFWLLISLVLVFAAELLDVLVGVKVLDYNTKPVQIVAICLPFIVLAGYIIGSILGRKIQKSLL